MKRNNQLLLRLNDPADKLINELSVKYRASKNQLMIIGLALLEEKMNDTEFIDMMYTFGVFKIK